MLHFRPILAGCTVGCIVLATSAHGWARSVTPIPGVQLAQNSQCQAWGTRLNEAIAAFNSRCSGTLDPPTYQHCQRWQRELNEEIQSYNRQCGR
jgi:hypothetical protein